MPNFFGMLYFYNMFRKLFKTALFWSAVVIFGLMLLNWQGLLATPKNLIYQLTQPAQNSSSQMAFKISHFFSFFADKDKLIKENSGLKDKIKELEAEIADLGEIARENEFLKQQLSLPSERQRQIVLADVIGQEPTNLGKYLLISAGSNSALQEDSAVIVAGNILVGRIIEVGKNSSKVLLINDGSSLVNALVQENRTKGIVKGKGTNELVMDLILQENEVVDEQKIITSGLAGIYPRGLLIGKIAKVMSSDPQIFQQAKIEPAADFDSLEKVFVIVE